MKISVIAPVRNESQFIGYSIMVVLPYIHEILYSVADDSNDGTIELLTHIKRSAAGDKLKFWVKPEFSFNPHDQKAYNHAFNFLIEKATGEAVWFLHPDMIVTNPEQIEAVTRGPMAWWVNMTSYAKDLNTEITEGRTNKWKNIHSREFGLHYFGAYGSQNEDFYHSDITGDSHEFYGTRFNRYPFEVSDSGISVNHYCEAKPYERRLEKMMKCIQTQTGITNESHLKQIASNHPRVCLEETVKTFGSFKFKASDKPVPEVFEKYKHEFEPITKKEPVNV